MDSVLQNWLIERLGPDCVPEAEHFCTAMADGTLLAHLLHSYGIIDTEKKNKINVSDDPLTRLENLNFLLPYLKTIKIKVDELILKKVAKQEPTNAVRLLYKVYTKLEPINSLRLEVEQKEKETSGKYPPRFTVFKVHTSEASPRALEAVNPLIIPLKERSNVIAWHRAKYEEMLNILNKNRRRLTKRKAKLSFEKGRGDAESCSHVKRSSFEEAERKSMEFFAQRDKDEEEKNISMQQLLVEQVRGECLSKDARLDTEKIRDYVPYLKRKIKREEVHRNIKKSVQKVLISEAWEKLTREQESEFDLRITKKLLKQSQYEKQIISKLHDIRDEKTRIIKNRKFVQNLIFKESEVESENRWLHELNNAAKIFQQKERVKMIEIDYQKKIDEQKARLKKERCTRDCTEAVNDMIDAAIKTSDFVDKNKTPVPQKLWDEWKVLFIKSQPIFEVLENIEDILEPEGDEEFEAKREIESHRQHVLDEADFEAYIEVKGPWLLEDLCPELGVLLEPQNILGYIVYRILDSKYPTCPVIAVDLPPAKIAVSLIGLEDDQTLAMLQSLLDTHLVQIVQIECVIEYFISTYQEELFKIGDVDENLIIATERTKAELSGKKYEPPEKKDVSEQSRPVSSVSKDSSTTAETNLSGKSKKKPKKDKKNSKHGKEKVKKQKAIQLEDKEVQTDDEKYKVELTPIACLGKMAFETLAIGEKVGDTLMTKMLVEYIKNKNVLDWVLLNYPENYSQAKLMEEALVGVSLPSEEEVIETLETLEGVGVREIGESKPKRKKGCSRLVPNTFGTASCDFPKSYLTAYITLSKKSPLEEESQDLVENISQECSEVETKSVSMLDGSHTEKGSDHAGVPQATKISVSFSGPNVAKDLEAPGAGISKIPPGTKATALDIKATENLVQKKESIKWKDSLGQPADEIGEFEDEITSYGEVDGEIMEEDIIGQEIEEEEKLCPLDKFYLNQGISYKFYYEDFDFQTLKNLAKLIIGDSDDMTKGSVELFGPVLEELEEYLTNKSEGKDISWNAKRLVSPQSLAKTKEKKAEKVEKLDSSKDNGKGEKKNKTKGESAKKGKKKGKRGKKDKTKSKEDDEQTTDYASEEEWSGEAEGDVNEMELEPEQEVYMSFDIPQELLVTLATMWENLEEVYIKDFKESFFMKRIYDAAIFPYAAFVKNSLLNLIKGADSKQIFVHDFQMQFNAIDEDLRSDVEMKSELHARVYELRMALYDIADGHKFEVESERQRIIRTNWVTEHMAAITNIFLLAIQLEADRFVDTLQMLQDYYRGMLDKPPAESTLEKFMVTRIELATPTITPPESESEESIKELLESSAEDIQSERQVSEGDQKVATAVSPLLPEENPNAGVKSASGTAESVSKSKVDTATEKSSKSQLQSSIDAKIKSVSEKVGEMPRKTVSIVVGEQRSSTIQESSGDIAKNFVENLLIDVEADSTLQSPFHSIISDTVDSIVPVMDSYIKKQLDVIAHEEPELAKKDKKGKHWKDRDTSPEAELKKAKMIELRATSNKFFEEWKTVLNSEVERAEARLRLILKRAFQDLYDIMHWAESLFHGLHEQIAARYKGEIAAVDELCKVLCNAIEDEQRIQEELVIDGDEFFTRPYVLMFPRPSPEEPLPIEEPYLENTFRVEQLKRLLQIFRMAAPSGLMPERALCYILEDLIMCRYEGHEFPPMWYQLTSSEVPELLEAIFGKVEYVEWREFIVRALGLGYPSMRQVLKMREEFLNYDISLKDNVSVDTFNQITLWFQKNVPEDEVTQLHIRLAKELLLNMFQSSDSSFGYMTFLLNFCKDEDPKRGLAKALALKLGKPVVVTEDEYKIYQQALEEEEMKQREATASAKEVLWEVTDDAVQSASGIFIKEIVENIEEKAIEIEEQAQLIEEILEDVVEIDGESEQELSDDKTEVIFKHSLSSGSTDEEDSKNILNSAVKIPAEVLVNVLTTCLPWHGKVENVLDAGEKSLLMKLDQVCEELGDEDNCVISHEFLSHKFICELLNTTHKFHAFHLEEKVESIFITNEFLDTLYDRVVELAK